MNLGQSQILCLDFMYLLIANLCQNFMTFRMIILHNEVCISVTVCNLRGHCHFNVCICRACAIVGVQVYGTQQLSILCFNY